MKKIKTRKWVIPFSLASIFAFTIVAVWLQYVTGVELSPTLITCVFGFFGWEVGLCASITKTKEKCRETLNYEEGEEE
jgi:ABC-type Co2+ transport system permease subunit